MKYILLITTMILSTMVYSQNEQTVSLVVSGQGANLEEAKQQALRSAIEQAFGAFVSSETVISNDSFISDNITSLSSGSVNAFEILSQTKLPDSSITLTLKATVSLSKIQSITQSKGHTVTFDGGLFGINLKLMQIQSDAEVKVIKDLVKKSLLILENSLDFKLELVPPQKSDLRRDLQKKLNEGSYTDYWETNGLHFDDMYKIQMIVEARPNSNLDVFIDYFLNTLSAIKMSDSEIDFAKQSGNGIFKLTHYTNPYVDFYLRNKESITLLKSMFNTSTLFLINYDIVSDGGIINFTPLLKNVTSKDNTEQNYLKLNNIRDQLQVLDSNHYVLVYDLLGSRKIDGTNELHDNYPTGLTGGDYHYNKNDFGFTLYKKASDYYWGQNNQIYFVDVFGRYNSKSLPTKNNMNLRYQVIDYYLPVNDVTKLNSIKIIKHDGLSKAR